MKSRYFKLVSLAIVITFSLQTFALGSTILKNLVCPICQIHFSNISPQENSDDFAYIDGMPEKLKLEILPTCPMCKGIFPKGFSFTPEQLSKMKQYLSSDQFKSIKQKPQYYIFSNILEFISYDSFKLADAFLKASLEFVTDSRDFSFCMRKAQINFHRYLKNPQNTNENKQLAILKIGEIYRRTRFFKKSLSHFKKYKNELKASLPYISEAITLSKIASKRNDSSRQRFLHNTKLHTAIISENRTLFKKLLTDNPRLNLKNSSGETPLLTAIKLDKTYFVLELLKNKANPNVKDFTSNSALHYACLKGNLTIVKALIQSNAKINIQNINKTTAIQSSIRAGKLNIAAFLINQNARTNMLDLSGNNLIHLLAYSNQKNTETTLALLLKSKININARNYNSQTPVHCFAPSGTPKQFQQLINAGANLNAKLPNGETILFLANPSLIGLLIENGADINIKNNSGKTAFENALLNQNTKLISAFKATSKFGLKPNAVMTNQGNMTVFDAVSNIDTTALSEILHKESRFASFKRQYLGETPLHLAILHKNIPAIQILLKNGANTNSANDFRRTPMHYAAMVGILEIIQILAKNKSNIFAVDIRGNTPLHDAAKFNNKDAYYYLLELGASPDTKNNNQKSPKMILDTTK